MVEAVVLLLLQVDRVDVARIRGGKSKSSDMSRSASRNNGHYNFDEALVFPVVVISDLQIIVRLRLQVFRTEHAQ